MRTCWHSLAPAPAGLAEVAPPQRSCLSVALGIFPCSGKMPTGRLDNQLQSWHILHRLANHTQKIL